MNNACESAGGEGYLQVRRAAGRTWRAAAAFVATPGRIVQFARYLLVSAVALAVDLAAFWSLLESGTAAPTTAGAAGVLAGLVVHYALSSTFVFAGHGRGKGHGRLLAEYLLTGVTGIAITTAVIFIAVVLAGFAPLIAKAFAVAITFVAVYVLRATLVFHTAEAT